MDTTSVEQIAEAVEEELERLRVARPALSSRIKRAENILVEHLSCRRQRLIRARVRSGELGEDNHDDLTWFDGDLLCRGCANSSGVLY